MLVGQLIDLDLRRDARRQRALAAAPSSPPPPLATGFYFDVVSPLTYLAAERVERLFPAATWAPVDPTAIAPVPSPGAVAGLRELAETRAAALKMPLVWPETALPFGEAGQAVRRAAAYAAASGRGSAFVVAAGRLAFCGGFELDDPEVIAEAAVAARLSARGCLAATVDREWDERLVAAAYQVAVLESTELPAIMIARRLFGGEQRLAEAAAVAASMVG
jgi:2-hydroxychromene-2-carboxylate isomerase